MPSNLSDLDEWTRAGCLARTLNDGNPRSLAALGQYLRCSEQDVRRAMQRLDDLGVKLQETEGERWFMGTALNWLDAAAINTHLARTALRPTTLNIQTIVDSTNRHLARLARSGVPAGSVCLAEAQVDGRGRRGRRWISPLASNIYLSILWSFGAGLERLSGLSLAAGVAVARALESCGAEELGLKWPNDLIWSGRKLGGLLVDLEEVASGKAQVIVGVGVNVNMPQAVGSRVDQPWVDLDEVTGGQCLDRNKVTARLINGLCSALDDFARAGWAQFSADWARFDRVVGRVVRLELPTRMVVGRALGVGADGALRLETENGIEEFRGGEVSLRFPQ